MRRALLLALAAAALVSVGIALLPGPEPLEDSPPPPPPPALPGKVELEEVDLQWKASLREALAAASEGEVQPATTTRPARRVATVSPEPDPEETPPPTPEPEEKPAAPSPPAPEPAPPAPTPPAPPPAPPMEQLDKEAVIKAVSWLQPEIAGCFEQGLARDRSLAGTVYARFVIEVDRQEGRIREPAVDPGSTTLRDAQVQRCIVGQLAQAEFPVPGVTRARVRVRYPFTMRKAAATPF